MTVDISERKRAERALAERNLQLALAGKAARVGSYAYDVGTDVMQVEEGYAVLHGLPDGTKATTRSEWKARVHNEDLARLETVRRSAAKPSAMGEASMTSSTELSALPARYAGSSRAVSFHMMAIGVRSAWLASALTSRIASWPKNTCA
jgi:hypothetical protein